MKIESIGVNNNYMFNRNTTNVMKTTVFDAAVATEVENLVMTAFDCQRYDIIQFIDSYVKKAVVFVLYYHFGYNKRLIGWNYKMTHWYVPAACEEIKVLCEHDAEFKSKMDFVLTKIKEYVCKEAMVA